MTGGEYGLGLGDLLLMAAILCVPTVGAGIAIGWLLWG